MRVYAYMDRMGSGAQEMGDTEQEAGMRETLGVAGRPFGRPCERMVGCRRCVAGVVRRLERHFRCGTSTWGWDGGQFSGIADVEHDVERTNIVG